MTGRPLPSSLPSRRRPKAARTAGTPILAVVALLAACGPVGAPMPANRVAVVEPSYVFALGVQYNDVISMLGPPTTGPRFNNYSNTREITYTFPTPVIQIETQLPNGVTRSELVDRIHMFFDFNNLLVKMVYRGDRNYGYITDMPIQRITVLPRVDHQHPVKAPPIVPAPFSP